MGFETTFLVSFFTAFLVTEKKKKSDINNVNVLETF